MPAVSAGILLWRRAPGGEATSTGASHRPAGASHRPAGASDRPAGASDRPAGASDWPAGASDWPAGACDRHVTDRVQVLLVHPGGPYWAKKDAGAWSIPKGEVEEGELGQARLAPKPDAARRRPAAAVPRPDVAAPGLLAVARREFREETGLDPDALAAPGATYVPLGGVKQRGHKIVYAWALEGDCDPAAIVSNEFEIEWPLRSGRTARFPEVDRAAWFDLLTAHEKIVGAQRRFLDDLHVLASGPSSV